MSQPMADAARSAASVLFNLTEYDVLHVVRDDSGGRRVTIATPAAEVACPGCGVLTGRVHQRTMQRVADVPFDGLVEVVWLKKRWRCVEALCARVTFTEATLEVPFRARLTPKLPEIPEEDPTPGGTWVAHDHDGRVVVFPEEPRE